MNNIQKGIKAVRENKLEDMREAFRAELTKKAAQKLEEKKEAIAKSYFGQK